VSGRNVWIHDVSIYNQDDCIAVKKDAQNMLFERISATGLGLSIGGIGHDHVVRNITFRHCTMQKTVKGIYIKVVSDGPTIRDVLCTASQSIEPARVCPP
jgi:polygalacturonase